jgi:hypothetical protein
MKKRSMLLAFASFISFCITSSAQEKKIPSLHPENLIKVNLTAIALKNYSLQYERVLNRKFSIALACRAMPSSALPFKDKILSSTNNDQGTIDAINALRLKNMAITPELRFYLSKRGYGRGFYIAPFYRYASFEVNNLEFTYTNSSNTDSKVSLSGKLTSNTGGILLGTQWPLGKHFCIDIWWLGPHFGSGTGDFSGNPDTPFTQSEQDDIRQQLNDLDIPLTRKTVTVTSNTAAINLHGPWGGIRSGISFGVRF